MALAAPQWFAQVPADPANFHIYLLIGQSNMAGRAEIPEEIKGILDRCFLFKQTNGWEPASNPLNRHSPVRKGLGMQKLGPGYGFARTLLENDQNATIGLVVNARGGTAIDEWLGDSELHRTALARTREAMKQGTLKGVLWHQGESDQAKPDGYLEKLQSLIAKLRAELDHPDLPFIAGQISKSGPFNQQIARLPASTRATAFVSSDGLTTTDGTHFDTRSQLSLGQRYAEAMIQLRNAAP